MQKRHRLWMADWRDQFGKRHMKGFPTKMGASRFQTKMQRQVAAKKAPASAASAPSAKLGPRRTAMPSTK
jgi:hypothetical protein